MNTALTNQVVNGWSVTAASAANTAGKAEKAATAGKTHYITGFSVNVSAAAAGATAAGFAVQLKNGTTVIWTETLAASAAVGSGVAITFPAPIPCASGAAASIHCAALGASSVANMNLNGFTI